MWRHSFGKHHPENCSASEDRDGGAEEPASSEFNTASFGNFLEVAKNKLTVKYTGNGQHPNDVGAIQGNRRVPRQRSVYYYEVHVDDAGDRGLIGIGFADCSFRLQRQPGWEPQSYGYHGDDGKRFNGNAQGDDFGPTFSTGDVVGAGVHLERQEIFFTLNGKHLGVAFRNISSVPLWPTIGLHSKNEQVTVNFGADPFRFDLAAMVQEEAEQQAVAVQRAEVDAGAMHRVVRDYLAHYGYADTLAAFDSVAGLDGSESVPVRAKADGACAAARLPVRQAVRRHLMAGRVGEAEALLVQHAPGLAGPAGDNCVCFYLSCLKFIELVREGRVDGALAYAQGDLARLRGVLAYSSRAYDAMLLDVVALLAYEQPHESEVAGLLGLAQREAVADVVNAALLATAAAPAPGLAHCHATNERAGQAVLERLLQQLVAARTEALAANGGSGQPFLLRHHLLPPPAKASAASAMMDMVE
ncbi:hypothetical protein WJX81_006034 [Elliptochloris bilobata]|uniref:Uncharacterized protein n=1 Tax=Elliptochloris bilobata TaxID=381761 RepID=A0AAW1QZC9_9CHLO